MFSNFTAGAGELITISFPTVKPAATLLKNLWEFRRTRYRSNFRFRPVAIGGVHRRAIHGIAARRISAVGPVHYSVVQIEIEIDWFGQVVVENFNVFAVCRSLTLD